MSALFRPIFFYFSGWFLLALYPTPFHCSVLEVGRSPFFFFVLVLLMTTPPCPSWSRQLFLYSCSMWTLPPSTSALWLLDIDSAFSHIVVHFYHLNLSIPFVWTPSNLLYLLAKYVGTNLDPSSYPFRLSTSSPLHINSPILPRPLEICPCLNTQPVHTQRWIISSVVQPPSPLLPL